MTFASPERLWLLAVIPVLVVVYIILVWRKKQTGMRFTNTTLLRKVMPKQSQWRRHLAVALSLASLVLLTLAWARPNGIEYVPRERATVVLIIDVSQSMGAVDVEPSRLEAAKQAALDFVAELPEQYNVALVSLSGHPAQRMAPTTDRYMANSAIQSLKLADGTATGEAIFVALDTLQQFALQTDENAITPGAIVLISDGKDTSNGAARAPLQAAGKAKEFGIPIYTIAYGTQNGYVDLDGVRETVPPDPDALSEISATSGGDAFSATTLGQLQQVYERIGSEIGHVPLEKEVTAMWAGYGLVCAVIACLAAVSLAVRWP
ncbi:MAG: VWA domain-containing protein [Propionibacteriaceae bacterium]|nr:VWA domain-containing protein [Propionibacteriaceae bacterium]